MPLGTIVVELHRPNGTVEEIGEFQTGDDYTGIGPKVAEVLKECTAIITPEDTIEFYWSS